MAILDQNNNNQPILGYGNPRSQNVNGMAQMEISVDAGDIQKICLESLAGKNGYKSVSIQTINAGDISVGFSMDDCSIMTSDNPCNCLDDYDWNPASVFSDCGTNPDVIVKMNIQAMRAMQIRAINTTMVNLVFSHEVIQGFCYGESNTNTSANGIDASYQKYNLKATGAPIELKIVVDEETGAETRVFTDLLGVALVPQPTQADIESQSVAENVQAYATNLIDFNATTKEETEFTRHWTHNPATNTFTSINKLPDGSSYAPIGIIKQSRGRYNLGGESLVFDDTAVISPTIPPFADLAEIAVWGGGIVYENDANMPNPTSASGFHRLSSGKILELEGREELTGFRFIGMAGESGKLEIRYKKSTQSNK